MDGGNQSAVYSVRIVPQASTLRAEGRDVPLAPGMAEIKTGKCRVIHYGTLSSDFVH